MTDLLYLACVILLPVVPAFLLFKALGSAEDVSGPLMGLKIKLGGAFAGYFAGLVLLFVTYHVVWHPSSAVWKVHGTVTDDQGSPLEPLDEKNVTLQPASLYLFPGGSFDITFSAAAGDWPILVVSYPNYQPTTIPLDPGASGMKDDGNGHLTISNSIKLHKMPPYTGAGVAASPVEATPEHQP